MYPDLISLTSCVCPSLHTCPALSQSAYCNQYERFFFLLILRGHGWFVSAWHSDTSIRTPPNHAITVCDLLAKSLNTPSHHQTFLSSPPSHSTSLHRFHFSHSHHFSLTLSSCCLAMHGSCPVSFFFYHTHTCTQRHSHAYILYIFTRL